MAHFAQLDGNNVVTNVIVVSDDDCLDQEGNESESVGITFCQALFGADTTWKQTSYNGNIRKNYAGIDFQYDPDRDAFIPPKPFASWVLNEDQCLWEAPVAYPDAAEGEMYRWDEDTTSWVLIEG